MPPISTITPNRLRLQMKAGPDLILPTSDRSFDGLDPRPKDTNDIGGTECAALFKGAKIDFCIRHSENPRTFAGLENPMNSIADLVSARASANLAGFILTEHGVDDEGEEVPSRASTVVDLDNTRAEIDYIDRNGKHTRRPVIIQRFGRTLATTGDGFLACHCLLRNAPRTFILERVQGFITRDGEYLSTSEFLADRLGIDPLETSVNFVETKRKRAAYTNVARTVIRPQLSLLVIAAMADGSIHPEELDQIIIFAERAFLRASRDGLVKVAFDADLALSLEKAILDMAPLPESVPEHIKSIGRLALPDQHRFWQVFCAVISADGKVTQEERALLDSIERQIAGK